MQDTGMQGSTHGATRAARQTENLGEQINAGLGRLSETAQQTVERVTDAAAQAAQRLSQHTGELWEMQGRAVESARTYVRAHPIATIGIAIAVGLLLSRLTSRR